MARKDLLALTADDLAALTNRGTVKRALREIEAREVTAEIVEDDAGTVIAKWSDQVTCTLPAGKTVREATCTCVATVLCRHVMRTVIAYQVQHQPAAQPASSDTSTAPGEAAPIAAPPPPAAPWDPGGIDDATLEAAFKKPVLTGARTRFNEGLLVELVRSAKPTARFHQMACTLRFIVPGDVRYTHCDCAEAPPCSHVPLAVWAFRLLDAGKTAGLVATQQVEFPVPTDILQAGETLMRELAIDGMSGASAQWKDRMLRLAEQCEKAHLVWPGEIVSELVQQYERYAAHDARFSPEHVAALVGEWLIRADAIAAKTTAAPQLLIRGSKSDRTMEISGGRFIGLGTDVQIERAGVELTAYLQDADSGTVVGVGRDFANPVRESGEAPKDFSRLAQTPLVAQTHLAMLGAGQMITKGGKRAADHRLTVGRARATVSPQNFAWESLRAPVLAEDFQELRARLAILPPASLRPRLIAENLHVCPLSGIAGGHFNQVFQRVEALLQDARGDKAVLLHPYVDRGRHGSEALLAALADTTLMPRFISGHVRLDASGGGLLIFQPVMLVFDGPQGRIGIQPWIDQPRAPAPSALASAGRSGAGADVVADFPAELLRQAAELLLLGLRRADARVARLWQDLHQHGRALGYTRFVQPAEKLAEQLAQKSAQARWSPDSATSPLLDLVALGKLAQDLG